MILIAAHTRIKPEMMSEALAACAVMEDASQAEPGNISYRFYTDPRNTEVIFVFEEWETDDALNAHLQTPHMAAFDEAITRCQSARFVITRYVVSEASPFHLD